MLQDRSPLLDSLLSSREYNSISTSFIIDHIFTLSPSPAHLAVLADLYR